MRYLFNPALLDFLVLLALGNLAANLFHQVGGFGTIETLGGVSRVCAAGFIVALIYTGFKEPPQRR